MGVTLDQFTRNLLQSGLIAADALAAFQSALPPEKQSSDPKKLAQELIRAGKLTKFQAEAVYLGNIQGLVVDQYTVLDKIGQGGMGMVYKAQHRKMKRLVAIKVLHSKRLDSPNALQRFIREVESAAKLSHPNIVTAYDSREQDGIHYLIMEYVDGQDLAAIIKKHGPMPLAKAVDCCLQAARGLKYAHKRGIVHRDIKPSNLLLDKEGTVKVLDMGLARVVDAEGVASFADPDRLTATGQVMGTCDYMAPEQAFDCHNVDARADIYSLGCTLFRLLTGKPPYIRDTLMHVLVAHREDPMPSLCEERPDAPEEFEVIFQNMVAKDADDRYQSMDDVIVALEQCLRNLSGEDVLDDGESTNTRAIKEALSFLGNKPGIATATEDPGPGQKETVSYHPEVETGSSAAAARPTELQADDAVNVISSSPPPPGPGMSGKSAIRSGIGKTAGSRIGKRGPNASGSMSQIGKRTSKAQDPKSGTRQMGGSMVLPAPSAPAERLPG